VSNYQDKWGRFHDKPCINGEPSSNNGWIYTAYAAKVGVPVDRKKLLECFSWCTANEDFAFIRRSPGKDTPPVSRDEVLGAIDLRLLQPMNLNGWNFSPYAIPSFNLISFCKQLWQLRPEIELFEPGQINSGTSQLIYKHRNYFWENNLDQLYRFAFSVPLVDRHFILKKWGKFSWLKPSHILYAAIAKIDSFIGKDSGIRFLKYGKSAEAMIEEFPEDHPITLKVKGE
jgi:hypothetical protein